MLSPGEKGDNFRMSKDKQIARITLPNVGKGILQMSIQCVVEHEFFFFTSIRHGFLFIFTRVKYE
jgi:hypothetical protein